MVELRYPSTDFKCRQVSKSSTISKKQTELSDRARRAQVTKDALRLAQVTRRRRHNTLIGYHQRLTGPNRLPHVVFAHEGGRLFDRGGRRNR